MKYSPRAQVCSSDRASVAITFFIIGALSSIVFHLGNVDLEPLLRVSSTSSIQFTENLIDAWRHSPEKCDDWFSVQKRSNSYIDAYVIGSQKGATSQLTKHLHKLGVRSNEMKKEWHFFNTLDQKGDIVNGRTVAHPLPPLNISSLRLKHFKTGFPNVPVMADKVPTVQTDDMNSRQVVIDSTVEYLHSDRSAYLASVLTPTAKIIVTVRDPLERALSQFNMVMRVSNKAARAAGKPDTPITAEEFHSKVQAEVRQLEACGYDPVTASYEGRTSELINCLFEARHTTLPDNMLYVTRGLYHLHLAAWRNHFPAHRIHVVPFSDIMAGKPQVYEDLSRFLCMRKFPKALLDEFKSKASTMSFGQLAAKEGLSKAGFDTFTGNDRYLAEILPKTTDLLTKFYAGADKRLELLLGRRVY